MERKNKIGIGIITYNRPLQFKKCYLSIDKSKIDELIVVNDGSDHSPETIIDPSYEYIHHLSNLGVAKSKNDALNFLFNIKNCDHVFLIEDDIFIKDNSVFDRYIEASIKSGIQHFNYSQHGIMNKTYPDLSNPNPRFTVEYENTAVSFYPHCVGAFSYYSKKCFEEVNFMDENYFNACEHVDHTLQIIKKGMHPPFWFFADLKDSQLYLGDEEWSIEQSTISSRSNRDDITSAADKVFYNKWGCVPVQISQPEITEVTESLKLIYENR